MVRVAVCLAGCGVKDGSEIHEAVLTLLSLQRAGAAVQCCAPDADQMHVVNHLTDEVVEGESRNMLQESARIARGEIVPLSEIFAADYDALIFPGGFGAAKNLCDFAVAGTDAVAHPQVKSAICNFLDDAKVLGFICIAPTIAASALRDHHAVVELTVGNCPDTHVALKEMGVKTIDCDYTQIHVDTQNKIVSTPAYMLAENINQLAVGIDALVSKVVEMCNE
ncbi:MAG TPA: isoprenoid biosynthesis glyoxalase ElbB [Planctomycetes bacterium]|jgi:enhancing lycopene biosynthesis protein 2|nr:isoprenoid biosynthesis glyoxalase ElbB [Planctomycetota bacterium]